MKRDEWKKIKLWRNFNLSYVGCRSNLSFCHTLSLSLIIRWLQERSVILSHTVSVTYHMLAAGETCHSVTHCLCHLSYVGCRRDLSFRHTLSLSLVICWLQERPVNLSHTVSVPCHMLAAGETCHSVTHCLCHFPYVGCRRDLSFCHTLSLSLVICWLQESRVNLSPTVSVTYHTFAAGETCHSVTHCLCYLSYVGCRRDLSFCHTLSLSLIICWLQERPVILSHTVSVTYHMLAAGETCHSVTHCLCHLSYVGCRSDLSCCHPLSLLLIICWLQERPVILSHTVSVTYHMLAAGETCHSVTHCLCHLSYVGCRRDLSFGHTLPLSFIIRWLQERPVMLSPTVSVTYRTFAAGETCHSVTHCLCHLSYVGCRRDLSFCHTLSLSLIISWLQERPVILSHTVSVTYHMLAAGETCHSVTHCLCHLSYVGCRSDLSCCHPLSLSLIIRWLQERSVIMSHTVSVTYHTLAAGETCHCVTHCLCHLSYVGCRRNLAFGHTLSLSLIIRSLQERPVILSHTVSVTNHMLAAGETCHSLTHCLCHLSYVICRAGETCHFVTHCLCHLSYVGCTRDLSFCHPLSLSLMIRWLQERLVMLSPTVSVTYRTLAAGEICNSVTHCICHLSYVGCRRDLSLCHPLSLSLIIRWLQEKSGILSHTVSVTYHTFAAGETCHSVTHCLCHLSYVGCRRDMSFFHTLSL